MSRNFPYSISSDNLNGRRCSREAARAGCEFAAGQRTDACFILSELYHKIVEKPRISLCCYKKRIPGKDHKLTESKVARRETGFRILYRIMSLTEENDPRQCSAAAEKEDGHYA